MDEKLVNLVVGSLLHDIGKVIHRSGTMESHSKSGWDFLKEIPQFTGNKDIKECVMYHHGRELSASKVESDSLAYISYYADNISAYSDRRGSEIEGENKGGAIFNKTAPLSSVFNILNGNKQNYSYKFRMINEINYPSVENIPYTAGNYLDIKTRIGEQLKGIEIEKDYINSILHLLESTTTFVPSSTNTMELMDISLYDHSKTTAAIASCLYYYLQGEDYKRNLLTNGEEFKNEDAYLLYSCDISGIQNYIYTISGTKALKALRSRSLYLEILLENIADDLLDRTGLTRCNLIYTGGGHAYILLPNTTQIKTILKEFDKELREWFIQEFDISLFVATAYSPCNSHELATEIGGVYQRLSEELSKKKSSRYTAEDIIKLNRKGKNTDRECKECKKSGETDDNETCELCQSLIDISAMLIKDDIYFVVSEGKSEEKASLKLPFGRTLTLKNISDARSSNCVRIYSKNNPAMGDKFTTNLWMGDYASKTTSGNFVHAKDFSEIAAGAKGISRIAILRADVDNLGKAFISGFDISHESLSRTATLSRQLSMFFKYHINMILKEKRRDAVIVYSGGDDMFIAGSWNDIIDLSKDIKNAFQKYTQNTLTISAGIGIYSHTYPIARIAEEVGELEHAAKVKDEDKNKVALFKMVKKNEKGIVTEEDWILDWDNLPYIDSDQASASSIEEKLNVLRHVFNQGDEYGKAFLYQILELLRQSRNDRINIARYAYTLKRAQERYKKLDTAMFYKWIMDDTQTREMEIAITLYSYETRK